MSKIDELIQELCPDGVEYRKLGEVISYEQPTKYIVKSSNYNDKYSIPVLTAGQTFILGYTNENFCLYDASKDKPVVIFDDFTTSFHWVDFPFKVKSSAMKILTIRLSDKVDFRFVYYAMKCINYSPQDHARQWISIYSKFEIPIPPISIQQEIVNILDKFTTLEAELEAELEARKKQYEYYLNQLLTPVEVDGKYYLNTKDVLNKKLGDLVAISTGKLNANAMDEEGLYPFFTCAEKPYRINTYAFDTEAIIVSGNGSQVGHINHYRGKFNAYQRTYVLHKFSSSIIVQYLLFYLKGHLKSYILSNVKEGSVPYITLPMLQSFQIPIPPLEEQERIVSILEKFDALVSDISVGLPAEIETRKKQYEYYRNKLLTFKNIADAQGGIDEV